jgi:hypothetical protein
MMCIVIPRLKYSADNKIQCKIKEVIISDIDNNSCNKFNYVQSHNTINAHGKYTLNYTIMLIK